jgi:hypothetical protein
VILTEIGELSSELFVFDGFGLEDAAAILEVLHLPALVQHPGQGIID